MKKVFSSHWGWSTLSDWGGGDQHPNAIKLPDNTIVEITNEAFQAAMYQHFCVHPRSRAKYAPMTADGSVRLLCEGGGDNGGRSAGQRWARTTVICPKGSVFLYGGRCRDCGGEMRYSDDPHGPSLCPDCLEIVGWQERDFERQQRAMQEEEGEER